VFRGRKHGGQRAQLRGQTAQRGLNALAISGRGAWRMPPRTMAGRAYPAGSWAVVCAPQEWATG
jgi:hypothetical protein